MNDDRIEHLEKKINDLEWKMLFAHISIIVLFVTVLWGINWHMKWINELNLTRNEKGLAVAALCLVETDITPRMDSIGNFSIEFAREVLSLDHVIRLFFSLDQTSLKDVASLTEKIYETSNI